MKSRFFFAFLPWVAVATSSLAWDYAGHRAVNQIALAALPDDFPAFVRQADAAERIAFLAGEPDRWRNVPDLPIRHANGLDHYCDLEFIPEAGLEVTSLSSLRYEFAMAFAAGRAAHPENFAPIDPAKNADRTREWPGFAPWAITEAYGKLRSAFSYLKVYQELGTPDEIANAQANAIYVMGVMGHFVGDLAQPLHTTKHHNGWVGENPHGYTETGGIHAWIDGGFFAKVGLPVEALAARAQPAAPVSTSARSDRRDPVFAAVIDYFVAQHAEVERLYQLEKDGKFKADDDGGWRDGAEFLQGQLLRGGQMLAALWLTAWRDTVPDVYLRASLLRRQGIDTPVAK